MADEQIRVQIKANIADLQKKLNGAKTALRNFDKGVEGTGSGMKKLGTTTSTNTVPALTSFSQVVQDAPYGIRGVANNITQLTSQFGYLSKSTGGAKNALKAMVGSLAGPAGILLAVSLVTSALVTYGDEIGDFIKGTSEATKAQRELTEATKEYMGTVGKEISTLNILLDVAKDETLSKEKRTKAVKKINELYPDYLDNLTLEGVNSETTAGQVDKLTESLIKQATVKGLMNRISEVASQKFDAEQKSIEDYTSVWNKLGSGVAYLLSTQETYTTSFGKGSQKRQDAIQSEADKIKELQDAIIKIIKEGSVSLDDLFGGGSSSSGDGPTLDAGLYDSTIGNSLEAAFEGYAEIARNGADQIGLAMTAIPQYVDKELSRATLLMESFNKQASNLITGSIANTFSNLGESIGEALATGGNVFQAIGKSILQSVGNFLSELGKLMIQYGTMAVIKGKLDLAIAAGGPIAIAAGLAAIAIGTALSTIGGAFKAAVSSQSSGGSVSGDVGGSGSTVFSGSSISSASGRTAGGTYVFEIQGTKLVGVLKNTLNRNNALGGNLNLT